MHLTRSKIKELHALGQKKFRDEHRVFQVEGVRMIQEAVDSDFEIVEAYFTAAYAGDPAGKMVLQKLRQKCPSTTLVSERELQQAANTVTAQGVLAVLRQKTQTAEELFARPEPQSVLVALDAVADPGNLGSIVRTCDWFGVQGLLLGANSVDLYNPKVIRATMGGIFHLPVVPAVDLLPVLSRAKTHGYTVYATDAAGETHFDRVRFSPRSLIVFGNEAWGVSDQLRQLSDARLAIRRYGTAESLNVGVACGIILSGVHRLMLE